MSIGNLVIIGPNNFVIRFRCIVAIIGKMWQTLLIQQDLFLLNIVDTYFNRSCGKSLNKPWRLTCENEFLGGGLFEVGGLISKFGLFLKG